MHGPAARHVLRKRFNPRDWTAAEDAIVEAALQLWLDPLAYDPAKGSLRSYFIGIAIRCHLSLTRKGAGQGVGAVHLTDPDTLYAAAPSTAEDRERSWARAHEIRATIGTLPPLHQRVIEKDIASPSCRADTREVARELGITRNHVGVIRNRYKKALAHHHYPSRQRRLVSA